MSFLNRANNKTTLTDEQYGILFLNSQKYQALMAAGVEQWEGYDKAMDTLVMQTIGDIHEQSEDK